MPCGFLCSRPTKADAKIHLFFYTAARNLSEIHREVSEARQSEPEGGKHEEKADEDEGEDQCMIQFSGGFPIFVHGTLESVAKWLNDLKG